MFCCDFARIEKPKWRNTLWFSVKIGLALKELISNADRFSLKSLGKTFLNWTSVSSTIEIKLRKEEFFPYFLNLLSSEHLGILEKMEHEHSACNLCVSHRCLSLNFKASFLTLTFIYFYIMHLPLHLWYLILLVSFC